MAVALGFKPVLPAALPFRGLRPDVGRRDLDYLQVTVADKHYVRPSDREFFEALAWLEGALGLKS
jgi:hypothetical protein